MDSLTQVVLGASVAAISVPAKHRRKAILAGAMLGTLPDMDVLIDYGNSVANFTYHRGFSHSLFVLFPFSLCLWLVLRRFWSPVRTEPRPWLIAIMLALVTHPLLDAHTAYGTQLLWPLEAPPVMWSTIFIIDPLYTLPLLTGVVVALFRADKKSAAIALATGISLSTLYLGWSWLAKITIEKHAFAGFAQSNQVPDAIFSTPAPFNTLLWRIVVLKDDDYLEGYYSFLADQPPVQFTAYSTGQGLQDEAEDLWALNRMQWFSQNFVRARVINESLVLTDLRMGFEPKYVFNHFVARREGEGWVEVNSKLLRTEFTQSDINNVWDRILGRVPSP